MTTHRTSAEHIKIPCVSVIIPDYNHARYIPDAINSVLNQNYSSYEIIVVDDGSTDNSREVVAGFHGQVRYIWQKNKGLSAARNTGIRAAKGEFISLLDADDMLEEDFLLEMVKALDQHPEAEAVYCGYRFVDGNNAPLPQTESRQIPPELFYQALLSGNFLVPESILVRKRCYEQVGGFDEALRACEDWDMWLRIASRYPVVGITKILTRHRILPGSMSSDPLRMLTNRLAVIRKNIEPEPVHGQEGTSLQRHALGRVYLSGAVEYLQCHDVSQAIECFRSMIYICPDLLLDPEVYYEIGCGDQPKGFRGEPATLNLVENSRLMFTLLHKVLLEMPQSKEKDKQRRLSYGNAYLALSRLSYKAKQYPHARAFLLSSIRANPAFGCKKEIVSLFIKTFLKPMIRKGQ